MKKWSKFAAILAVGAFLFTACEKDVVLNVPADATIDLGDTFDPMTGVTVEGAKLADVVVSSNPTFSNVKVDRYTFTYTVEGETATRNVFVQADKLAKTYQVTDVDDDGTSYTPYPVTVTRGTEFNQLRFNELWFDNVIVNGTVNGDVITIPTQTFGGTAVSGTGTYDGTTQKILSITYIIGGQGGTSTFN